MKAWCSPNSTGNGWSTPEAACPPSNTGDWGLQIGRSDTWAYDGTTWSQTGVNSYGGGGWKCAMAFYGPSQTTVKHAGLNASGTYLFDGENWSDVTSQGASEPSGRYGHDLVYDEARGRLMMFGGQISGGAMLNETWVYGYRTPAIARETCDGTSDADGDGRLGCDDDDCWEACDPTCSPFREAGAACAADRPRCGDGTCPALLETAALCPADCS